MASMPSERLQRQIDRPLTRLAREAERSSKPHHQDGERESELGVAVHENNSHAGCRSREGEPAVREPPPVGMTPQTERVCSCFVPGACFENTTCQKIPSVTNERNAPAGGRCGMTTTPRYGSPCLHCKSDSHLKISLASDIRRIVGKINNTYFSLPRLLFRDRVRFNEFQVGDIREAIAA